MADFRFFTKVGPFTLGHLADISEASLVSPEFADRLIDDVSALDRATESTLACLHNHQHYGEQLAMTRAGAVVLEPKIKDLAPANCGVLVSEHPYKAFAKIAAYFYPNSNGEKSHATAPAVVHPQASVDSSAVLGLGVTIAAGAVIGPKAIISAGTHIDAHAVIAASVEIGKDCHIGAHVKISHAIIGDRVRIDPGTSIGQPGFGFFMDHRNGHFPVPQLGLVKIGNDVVIGSNTTIDRGSLQDTVIGDGCMIDNLVQIAHNVQIGRRCVIVAQVGISGSTVLEDYVTVAGQAGLTGHIKLGQGSVVLAQSGVMRDVKPGAKVGGSPAVSAFQWHKQITWLNQNVKKG